MQINHKYFSFETKEKKELSFSLGNFTDAGYFWGNSRNNSDDLWYFFGTLVSNQNLFDYFFRKVEKNRDKEVVFKLVKDMLVDSISFENYYPFLGGNRVWYFGEDLNDLIFETIAGYLDINYYEKDLTDSEIDRIGDISYQLNLDFDDFAKWMDQKYHNWVEHDKRCLLMCKNWQHLKDFFYDLYDGFNSEYFDYIKDFIYEQLEKLNIEGV